MMKPLTKRVVLFYLIALHLVTALLLVQGDTISRAGRKLGLSVRQQEITDHYRLMVAFHTRVDGNVPDGAVIFIGDSLVQGLAVSAVASPAVNFGIGRDTTVGVLRRIPLYSSIARAGLVVVAVGLNDMRFRSNREILANLRAVDRLIPRRVPVLFSGILPIDEGICAREGKRSMQRIGELNTRLKVWTETVDNRYFVDAGQDLLDARGLLAARFHIGDGVHLNSRGNEIWIHVLKEQVARLRRKKEK